MAGSRSGRRQKGHSLFVEDWIFQVISTLGYLGLALLLVAENLFPPIPSEVVLPLAGFVVGRGDLGFLQALPGASSARSSSMRWGVTGGAGSSCATGPGCA